MSVSSLSRSALGSLSPKQYTDLITSELFHFLLRKKISDGYTKDITKEFLTTYLTDSSNQKTTPSLSEHNDGLVGQQHESGSNQSTNHTDNTGHTSLPGTMKISKKHRKNPLIKFTNEEEVEQALTQHKQDNLNSIVDELTELIHSSQADIQSFVSGMREYRTIDDARKAIKHYDDMISARRISIMLRGGGTTTADSDYLKKCGKEIEEIEKEIIQKKLQFQETSAVTNYYRRRDIAHRSRRGEFVIFEDREAKINKAIDHLTRGEHCLIEGPTGTGKTVIAKEIAECVEQRLGSPATGSGSTISKLKNPQEFDTIMNQVVRLYAGHSRSNAQDLAVKLGMEGYIEIVEQLVGMLRAIHEGVPFIIDEIDLIPTETLMSIKALFTLKPGEWTIPDSGTGMIAYQIPRKPMLIATMNGASEKHKRNKLDPAMLRLFDYQDTLGYLDTEKTYDYLVGQLLNEHDYIDGVVLNEIANKDNGIIPNLCRFIDMVNQSYQGKKPINMPAMVTGVSMTQQGFLKDKVIEMQKLTNILTGLRIQSKDISLTEYVKSEILSWCLGHAGAEDTALLLRAAIICGLIDYHPTSSDDKIQKSSTMIGKAIIDHKHGRTEKTLKELFAGHTKDPWVVRDPSDKLLINAYQIGLQDYVTNPTNPQATRNKPKLNIGYHQETIKNLENIKQELNTITAIDSINTIKKWIDAITQPDTLTTPRTDTIGEDERVGWIQGVFQAMQKKHQIKSNTTSETKKNYLKKEQDIWKSIQALDGLTTYVQDILKDERYNESPPPPPPNHTPSGSYQLSEYPLDNTTVRGKRILGIRNNFLDGIKRNTGGQYIVDTTRNQEIITKSEGLISKGLFKIHQVSYNNHTIPVFSLWDNSKQEWVSRTTTQHIISLDQAKKRNTDPNNTNKSKLTTYDFKDRTPKKTTKYNVTTMNYTDIKDRSTKGISSLPYGDHLQDMAEGVEKEGVQIEVECTPNGHIESTVLPLLQSLTGYTNHIIPGVSHDVFGVMQYLTGGVGRLYHNDTNSYVCLSDGGRWLSQGGIVDCALCAKVTWTTRPQGEPVLPGETKDKPQEFVDFEKAWMDKVKNFPTQATFGEMILGGIKIPVFSKKLNDFGGSGKTDDQVKKEYENAIKKELKQRIDLWMKQYVSYIPNYKGTKSHGIMIRNSSINTKLNNGKPIIIYALNNKDYIESKIQHLGGINNSSASTYNDYITGNQKIKFYRRTFTDKDNKTLDTTQPSTWLDSGMYGTNNLNLLKPIIQDIIDQDIIQGTKFQGFPNRDDRASMISQDCHIPYTKGIKLSNDKNVFGLVMAQYLIHQGYWFWSQQMKGNNTSSCVYLDVGVRGLAQFSSDICALFAMDYSAHP